MNPIMVAFLVRVAERVAITALGMLAGTILIDHLHSKKVKRPRKKSGEPK